MKNKTELNKERFLFLQALETALRSLQYFCVAYNFCFSNIQPNFALSTIISGNYTGISYSEKIKLFGYFMALKELLPALYELQEHLDKEGTYRDEVSAKDMYASFKRHPE